MAKPLKSNAAVASRIKRMMQSDEDVGKVSKASPVLIAAALDGFIEGLISGSVEVAESRNAKTLTAAHLKAHVVSQPLFDFCKDSVASAPDLPSPEEEAAAADNTLAPVAGTIKRARPRSQGSEGRSKRGRGGGRGKGRGRLTSEDDEADPELFASVAGETAAALEQQAVAAVGLGGVPAALLNVAPALDPGFEAEEEDYD